MDAKGARFQGVIESAGRQEVLVTLERALPEPAPSPVEITLGQSLLKSRPMDYVIQKTSELGVDCILPFSSGRTVVKPGKDRLANKLRHWREIALNAAKQSDRAKPAEISPLSTFEQLIDDLQRVDALKVVFWEDERSTDLKALLRTSDPVKRVVGVVGPEGGFAQEEINRTRESGFLSVSLGHRVLRAETAAITMVAIFQYEWGDLSLQ
jgi:16S rRNA (uracil1498-N3)-methyltransferase